MDINSFHAALLRGAHTLRQSELGYFYLALEWRQIPNPWASLVPRMVKNVPAMWENQVQSLGWEDPLEKGMATHSRILGWRIPWTEEPEGL